MKDQEYNARFVFVGPPNVEDLEARLRESKSETEEKIQQRLTTAKLEIEQSKLEGCYDLVLVDDLVGSTYKTLEDFVLGEVEELGEAKEELSQTGPGDAEAQRETVSKGAEMANGEAPSTEDAPTLPPPESMETDADLTVEQGDTAAKPDGNEATT